MRALAFTTLLMSLPTLALGEITHYVVLVNTADTDIVSIEIAPSGGTNFQSRLSAGTTLLGGGNELTLAIMQTDEGCMRDLRFGFADGRRLLQRDFNICKYRTYHTGQYLHKKS